jgi:hypothetical protein
VACFPSPAAAPEEFLQTATTAAAASSTCKDGVGSETKQVPASAAFPTNKNGAFSQQMTSPLEEVRGRCAESLSWRLNVVALVQLGPPQRMMLAALSSPQVGLTDSTGRSQQVGFTVPRAVGNRCCRILRLTLTSSLPCGLLVPTFRTAQEVTS